MKMKCVTAMIYSLLCKCLEENLNCIIFIIDCTSKTSKNHKLWLDSLIRDFSILSIYRFLKKGIGENQGKGKQEDKHEMNFIPNKHEL